MKTTVLLGLMAVTMPLLALKAQTSADMPYVQAAAAFPTVSPGAAGVVKMAEAGTSDEVLMAYVQNSMELFELSADQVLYLRDVGLSSPVIAAMLNRDAALRIQPSTYDQSRYQPSEPATVPLEPPALEPAPVPAPAVVAAPAPVYVTSPPAEVSYFYNDLSPYGTWAHWRAWAGAGNHALWPSIMVGARIAILATGPTRMSAGAGNRTIRGAGRPFIMVVGFCMNDPAGFGHRTGCGARPG